VGEAESHRETGADITDTSSQRVSCCLSVYLAGCAGEMWDTAAAVAAARY